MGQEAAEPLEVESRPQSRREWSGWLGSVILPLLLLAAIAGGLWYFQSRQESDGADAGFGTVALPPTRNATDKPPAAREGRAAPDFLLQTLDLTSLRLSDQQGRPVLVNFFASWCTPCRLETPELIATYEANRARGLVLIGVDLQEADGPVRDFAGDFGISYPIVMDRRGQVANTWRIGGPVEGIPASYFIDARGVVRKVVFGPLRENDLREGLALILEGSP
jgi:peroxiredoxin